MITPDLCSREGKPVGQDDWPSDQYDSASVLPRSTDGTECCQFSIAPSPFHRMSADCRQAAVDGQQDGIAVLCSSACGISLIQL